jgi:hypothetical protein
MSQEQDLRIIRLRSVVAAEKAAAAAAMARARAEGGRSLENCRFETVLNTSDVILAVDRAGVIFAL